MLQYTLLRDGKDYKGNLHAHTTLSDGELTPEAAFRRYKEGGYSFLAITDHRRYGVFAEENTKDFLVFPGVELDTLYQGKHHHIVGLSTPSRAKLSHGDRYGEDSCGAVSPQRMIDSLLETGNIAIYAHPSWGYATAEDMRGLHGLTGIEIFNYSCDQRWRTGLAEQHYAMLLEEGCRLACLSVDDTHMHTPDTCGGYITVRSRALTHDAIFDALLHGSFYASASRPGEEAPRIHDFYVEEGVAHLTTSPCDGLYLLSGWAKFRSQHGTREQPVSTLSYEVPPQAAFVRAVAVDFEGRVSWSQPIWLK